MLIIKLLYYFLNLIYFLINFFFILNTYLYLKNKKTNKIIPLLPSVVPLLPFAMSVHVLHQKYWFSWVAWCYTMRPGLPTQSQWLTPRNLAANFFSKKKKKIAILHRKQIKKKTWNNTKCNILVNSFDNIAFG